MANRRQFIQCGLTFSTLSVAGLTPLSMAVAAPAGPTLALESFVADVRFAESIGTAEALKKQGVPVAETAGDMTDLWIGQYSRQWKRQPMSLAGVTGKDVLFVLETLAPDHAMRLVYKTPLPRSRVLSGHTEVALLSWIIVPKKIADGLPDAGWDAVVAPG